LRYAHGAPYVCASLRKAGLVLSQLEQLSARNERPSGSVSVAGSATILSAGAAM